MARKIQLKNKSGEILHPETEASAITDLVANPGGSGLTELTSLKIGDTSYKVAANPDMSGYATTQYVDNRVNAVLGGEEIAEAYDTMKEIADYLDEHDDYIGQLSNTAGVADEASVLANREKRIVNPIFIPKHFYLENIDLNGYDNSVFGFGVDVEFTANIAQQYFEFKVIKYDTKAEMFKQGYEWNGEFVRNSITVLNSNLISYSEAEGIKFWFTKDIDPNNNQRIRIALVLERSQEGGYSQYGPIGYVDPVVPSSEDLKDGASIIKTSNIANYLPSVPTKVSQLTNDSGYLTSTALNGYALQANVPSALSDLNNDTGFITGSSLAGLATENYVDNKVAEIDIPSKVSDLTNDSGFITASSLSGLASETYVDNKFNNVPIPTLVSQLTNDMGYITSHQSLAGLATESYVNNAISEILGEGQISANFDTIKEVADYLTQHGSDYTALVSAVNAKADASSIPTKTSDLTNDSGFITSSALNGYATESYVNSAIANAGGSGSGSGGSATVPTKTSELTNDSGFITSSDLSTYALKSEIPEKVSDITNDTGFITASALQPYALAQDVPTKVSDLQNDSGFLTSHQDISGKQDKLTAGAGITINENNVISAAGVSGVSYQVISEFPETGVEGTIYLKSKGGKNKDVYEEYIWVNNDFELIGSTEVDLSGYLPLTGGTLTNTLIIQTGYNYPLRIKNNNASSQVDFVADGNTTNNTRLRIDIGSEQSVLELWKNIILVGSNFIPHSSNTYNLGGNAGNAIDGKIKYWKDLYLSGNLTDGTNSVAIADIASKTYVDSAVANVSSSVKADETTIVTDGTTGKLKTAIGGWKEEVEVEVPSLQPIGGKVDLNETIDWTDDIISTPVAKAFDFGAIPISVTPSELLSALSNTNESFLIGLGTYDPQKLADSKQIEGHWANAGFDIPGNFFLKSNEGGAEGELVNTLPTEVSTALSAAGISSYGNVYKFVPGADFENQMGTPSPLANGGGIYIVFNSSNDAIIGGAVGLDYSKKGYADYEAFRKDNMNTDGVIEALAQYDRAQAMTPYAFVITGNIISGTSTVTQEVYHPIDGRFIPLGDGLTLDGNNNLTVAGSGSGNISGENNGENWTSLTINGETYNIPSGGSGSSGQPNGKEIIEDPEDPSLLTTAIGGWKEEVLEHYEGRIVQRAEKLIGSKQNIATSTLDNSKNLVSIYIPLDTPVASSEFSTDEYNLRIQFLPGGTVQKLTTKEDVTRDFFGLVRTSINCMDSNSGEVLPTTGTAASGYGQNMIKGKFVHNAYLGTNGDLYAVIDDNDGEKYAGFLLNIDTDSDINISSIMGDTENTDIAITLYYYIVKAEGTLVPGSTTYHPIDGRFIPLASNGGLELNANNELQNKYGTPDLTKDGTYVLKATVSNGAVTYSWVLEA